MSNDSKLFFEIDIFSSYHIRTLCISWLHLFILHLYKYSFINKITLFIALSDFVKYPSRNIDVLMKEKE